MANKKAFGGIPTNYAFQLAGRAILYAPVNTSLPSLVQPIYDTSIPDGWSELGFTVDSVVDISIDLTTQDITTGVLQNVRRTYIQGQKGKFTGKVISWEPTIIGVATGQGTPVSTNSTSLNRSFKDLWFGGTLGNKSAFLIYEDFDIPLVEDASGTSYDQAWAYTPKAQKEAGINLSEFQTKTNVITIDYELLPYTNSAAGSRDVLLQMRWIGSS